MTIVNSFKFYITENQLKKDGFKDIYDWLSAELERLEKEWNLYASYDMRESYSEELDCYVYRGTFYLSEES